MSKQSSGPLGWSRMGLTPASRAGVLVAAVALQGCSHLTHFNIQRDLDGAPGTRSEAIFMDAKQRGVYTITRTEKDGQGMVLKSFQSFCAEPSPDALSNLAAQFGAKVSVAAKGDGSISGGFAEGAANIGLRTTSIQILRDITYRQCEAYANGGISKLGLETLQRRFQSTMVALLSIEQLTGAVRSPVVVLSGSATGTNAELIADLTEMSAAARSAISKSETEVSEKTAATEEARAAAEKVKGEYEKEAAEIEVLRKAKPAAGSAEKTKIEKFDAEKAAKEKAVADAEAGATQAESEQADAKETLQERKDVLTELSSSLESAKTAGGLAIAKADSRPTIGPNAMDPLTAKVIADAVTKITRDTLSLGYGAEVCTSIIGDQTNPSRAETFAVIGEQAERLMKSIPTAPTSSPEEKAKTPSKDSEDKEAQAAKAALRVNNELENVRTTSKNVLNKCLELITADATYQSKLGEHLGAKTALIQSVANSIQACATQNGCANNTAIVKELVNALKIALETPVGSSPLLLTQ